MTTMRLMAAATLALVAGWANAQATAPSSPAKRELIQRLLVLQQPAIEAMAKGMTERPAAALMQQAGMALQQRVPADKREAVAREIEADVRKYAEETTPIVRERAVKLAPTTIGPLLDERLTEDELRQVLAMLESPAVRKFQQVGGEMEKVLADRLITEMRPTIEPKLRALEQSVGRRLGIPAAASAPASSAGPRPAKK
jgi:uncharacterized protein